MMTSEFEDLRRLRRRLGVFCDSHVPSVEAFADGVSFRLVRDRPVKADGKLHHLTSTATCLESLREAMEPPGNLEARCKGFAQNALARPERDWISEGSAAIYCRCRGLPLVLTAIDKFDSVIDKHVRTILAQLSSGDGRFGVGEAQKGGSPDS